MENYTTLHYCKQYILVNMYYKIDKILIIYTKNDIYIKSVYKALFPVYADAF